MLQPSHPNTLFFRQNPLCGVLFVLFTLPKFQYLEAIISKFSWHLLWTLKFYYACCQSFPTPTFTQMSINISTGCVEKLSQHPLCIIQGLNYRLYISDQTGSQIEWMLYSCLLLVSMHISNPNEILHQAVSIHWSSDMTTSIYLFLLWFGFETPKIRKCPLGSFYPRTIKSGLVGWLWKKKPLEPQNSCKVTWNPLCGSNFNLFQI